MGEPESMAGLHGLTRAITVDHGPEGIRCNAVAPGGSTHPSTQASSQVNPESFRSQLGELHPVERTGSPEDLVALVTWLAPDDAGFVTGYLYAVDGGRMARLSLP